jgi:homoserine kinase
MSLDTVRVRVPATTANLGPGFDTLGLALALHNEVELAIADTTSVQVSGEGADSLPGDRGHLVLVSADRLAAETGRTVPGWRLTQVNRIPLARGLGSSSAAIVAGLVAANHLLQADLPLSELLGLAAAIEGHPDNVAPALHGGLTVCCVNETTCCVPFPAPALKVVVAIPDFEVSTEAARKVMPRQIAFTDGVFNATHAAMTLAALVSGDFAKLGCAMRDRLHQPYRAHLVPGFEQTMAAAIDAGAYGACLSGSGPSIAAFCQDHSHEIAAAMVAALLQAGVQARSLILDADPEGAKVLD